MSNMIIDHLEQLKTWFTNTKDVKHKIFFYYMIFLTGMSLFTVMTNILSGLNASYNYKWIFVALFNSALIVMGVRNTLSAIVLYRIGIYFLSLIILPVGWLASSGLVSPSITYSFLALIMVNTLTSGRERIFLNLCQIFLALCLIWLFYCHPSLFKTMSPGQQLLDWIINVPVVLAFAALLLTTFEKAYERERSDNQKRRIMLEKLSMTDSLTGLYNRSHMRDEIARFISVYNRTSRPFCVLMIDIDYFKSFNDTGGHLQGDQCLKSVSSILKESVCRNTDWVFRYGGEEFLVVLGYTDMNGAVNIAEQIQENLKHAAILHPGTGQAVTVSIGITAVNPENKDVDLILSQADKALYKAKSAGRNRIEMYTC